MCTKHFASLPFTKCNTELFSFLLLLILRVHRIVYFSFIQSIQLHLFLREIMDIYFELSQHISVSTLNIQYCQMNSIVSTLRNMHTFFAFAINSFNKNLSSNCYVNNVVIEIKEKNKQIEKKKKKKKKCTL